MAPLLAYWDMRGYAQPIRLLLHFCGVEFEDKLYSCGPAPDFSRECWYKEKFSHGLDFPNLPYYIDGDTKLTQSSAILHHIARKYNMYGETDQEKDIIDMVEDQLVDVRTDLVNLVYYAKQYEEEKLQFLKDVVPKLKALDDFLGKKKFVVGDKITFVDFLMYEVLDQHKMLEASLLEPHANLKAYVERIEALPAIAAYMKSDKFIYRAVYNRISKLHGQDY